MAHNSKDLLDLELKNSSSSNLVQNLHFLSAKTTTYNSRKTKNPHPVMESPSLPLLPKATFVVEGNMGNLNHSVSLSHIFHYPMFLNYTAVSNRVTPVPNQEISHWDDFPAAQSTQESNLSSSASSVNFILSAVFLSPTPAQLHQHRRRRNNNNNNNHPHYQPLQNRMIIFCNKDEVGKTVAIIVGVLAGLAVLIVLLFVCHKALGMISPHFFIISDKQKTKNEIGLSSSFYHPD
ncbi:hypothetical protein ACSBR1_008957 [Camellia fascicularis]